MIHSVLCEFPRFYKEVIIKWGKLSSLAALPSTVACQFMSHNKHTQIDDKSTYSYSFSNSNLNFIGQLFDTDGKLKSWGCIKHQFSLKNNLEIIHAVPQHWKESINNFAGNLNNLCIQDHHLINCSTIYSLEKLNTKELYHMQLLLKYVKTNMRESLMDTISTGN